MKLFIIFSLLFSIPYGYSQSPENEPASSESIDTKKALLTLRNEIKQYVDSLMLVLLDEYTPRENQMEILDEIRTIADINGEITVALNQMSQLGIKQDEAETNEGDIRDKNISLWAKGQAELIRKKQLALSELQEREIELEEDFWIDLALDGVVIFAGGVLFFVPAVGPAVSLPLTAGRISLTGKKLGTLLATTGVAESGWDIWNYLFGEERVLSFVSDIAFRDILTKELFSIMSSANPRDRYLAIELLKKATDEETLTSDLLETIQDERRSAEVRLPALRALRAVSNMNEDLKGEVINALRDVIDESQIPSLRETAVSVLGEMGEGKPEVAGYLTEVGDDTNKSDELRLIALTELGRNKDYFSISIEKLAWWLERRDYKKDPLEIQPLDIPVSFVDALLSAKREELSKSHIVVVREFIRSEILNTKFKLRFSETLLSWDDSLENKALLSEAYSNLAKDIGLYVRDDLFKENLLEENYGAFKFFTNRISEIEHIRNSAIALQEIESIIQEFKILSPGQNKIAEELENVVNSYTKMLEIIKN